MSPELHPDWQNDQDERPVRVSARAAAPAASVQPKTVTISRRPAAVVGILLVSGILISVYGVADLFGGQILPSPPDAENVIRITESGFVPASLTVEAGTTVTWQNDSTIPHLLTSDTLETDEGLLNTPAIFTGSTLRMTIEGPIGEHPYISLTSSFSGSILVTEKTAASSVASSVASISEETSSDQVSSSKSSPSSEKSSSKESSSATSSSAEETLPESSSSVFMPPLPGQVGGPQVPVIPQTPIGVVPRNPYASGQVQQPVTQQTFSSARSSKESLHGGAPAINTHKPTSQPASGPKETGILALLSIAVLVITCRKALFRGATTRT